MIKGLPSSAKKLVNTTVENLFDRMALHLLGDIPELRNKKVAFFSTSPNLGLANLFVQVLNRNPNQLESDALKGLLTTAHSYIEALKNKTKATIETEIDGYMKDQNNKGQSVSELEVQKRIIDGLVKAKSHIKTISETEATKTRNVAKTMQITRMAADMNVSDPSVYFAVVRDAKACERCVEMHLMPDRVTPRVWKLMDVTSQYAKKTDEVPSICGQHPNCRCTMVFLAPTYGFKNGKVDYIGQGHDEYLKQRG